MATKGLGISVIDAGIATTINQHLLTVPPNQRSYAWEDSHVQTLFQDLQAAVANNNQTYFLGTLVLTQGGTDRQEVADGQQRLATTSILIAAIRDYLLTVGSASTKKTADKYTTDFLLIYDEHTDENTPRLQLNNEDNNFFLTRILQPPSERPSDQAPPTISSHIRLERAFVLAKQHVDKIVAPFGQADRAKALFNWIKFLRESAMVIAIRVPDHINAYTMFETLNDRGLRASQTDILKNFLFGRAQDRMMEVQAKWSSMTGTIETVGDEELVLTYLKHYWTLHNGYTTERELASLVRKDVSGRSQAVGLANGLEEHAADYVGLLAPLEYPGWHGIDKETRAYLYILTRILGVEQIRPLLLATLKKLSAPQVRLASKMFLDWSVRFLVAGSGGGGPLDRAYGQLAKEIMDGQITTASNIRDKVSAVILRTDEEFKQAFSKARVSKNILARYYLRALELSKKGAQSPQLADTLDESYIHNVEHVLPQSQSPDWPIDEQIAQQYRKRFGNMALLTPNVNVKLGAKGFEEKRAVFATSPLLLTSGLAKYQKWGPAEIDARQEELAELAVKVWPALK
jgi:hypothetical protein